MMNETRNTEMQDRWEKFLVSKEEEDDIYYLNGVNGEESHVIAAVDMETGKVYYGDPAAREDDAAQELIQAFIGEAKRKHPYSIERLENILACVVDYECEELASGEGTSGAMKNLLSMGFSEEEMMYFGFTEEALED